MAFRSKADHPRMCVFAYTQFNLLAPVTLTNDLIYECGTIIQILRRRCICTTKMKFLGQSFQKLEQEQDTHRQTDMTKHISMQHSQVTLMIQTNK